MDSQITNIVIVDKCFKSIAKSKYYFRVAVIYENNTCVVQYMYYDEIVTICNDLSNYYDTDDFAQVTLVDVSSLLTFLN